MNKSHHPSEQGQAIVFLVIGLVVFLGFVALAIDGGMALADRRYSQNSADAAALAGASMAANTLENYYVACFESWTCTDPHVEQAKNAAENTAIDRAAANNFTIGRNLNAHNGVVASCVVTQTMGFSDKYIQVTVDISSTTQSNFAKLLFPQALHNEVDAVTRARPRQPVAYGNAIVGLNPDSCDINGNNGVTFIGNGTTAVDGGGVFSNGCLRGNGNAGGVTVANGVTEGHYLDPGNLSWSPAPVPTDAFIPPASLSIPTPDCSDPLAHNVNGLRGHLEPGLYCIAANLSLQQDVDGTGVTIYVPNGHVTTNGSAVMRLSAPTDNSNAPAIKGILLFVANGGAVTLNGTADDNFTGMIYAPKSDVKLTGTADNIFYGQVIGWNVKIGGNDNMNVIYNGCNGYTRPSFIELSK